MNQGLEILIARTKTHPEEFVGYEDMSHVASKWVLMVQNFTRYATDEEKEAWQEAMYDLSKWHDNKRRDDFTEAVMKELLVRDGEDEIDRAVRPSKLITAASMTQDALTILAGGGNYPQGGGYGGGGSGSVIVKTPKGTHTFTKNGVVTINTDEEITWLPKS